MTSEDLHNIFKQEYPSVIGAKVIVDPITKMSKNYGFVDMGNHEDYVKSLSKKSLTTKNGSTLIIKYIYI